MCKFFNSFINNQNNYPEELHFLGIDFEFNKVSKSSRQVALMQINLENNSNIGNIFILYPPNLDKDNLLVLINLITHKKIYKILHGSESLDIPYLFDQLLISKNNIDNFCFNFYDTKFLCDYFHIENNSKGKCSIYYLLLEHNIVTQNKINLLNQIEERTGPIYLININIYKMKNDILLYSLYDVLYLPQLIKKFLNKNKVYSHILPQISSIVNKFKRNIENDFYQLETFINQMNNYFIIDNNQIILLKDIYDMYSNIINDSNKFFQNLKQIHYFKTFLDIISKMCIYFNLSKLFKIYTKKNTLLKKINFNHFFTWISQYTHFYYIFNQCNNMIYNDLLSILHKK